MKITKLRNILEGLNNLNSDIEDSVIVLSDGLVVASKLTNEIDEDKIGTISAAIFSLASQEARQFGKGKTEQVMIKCGKNYIAMFKAGEEAVLVLDFNENAKLDIIIQQAVVATTKIIDSL